MNVILKIKVGKRTKLTASQQFSVVKAYCFSEGSERLAERYNVSGATIVNTVSRIFKASFDKGYSRECIVNKIKYANTLSYEEINK